MNATGLKNIGIAAIALLLAAAPARAATEARQGGRAPNILRILILAAEWPNSRLRVGHLHAEPGSPGGRST